MADDGRVASAISSSRARGENAEVAIAIAGILPDAGHSTFIQDQDFGNTNFMAKMARWLRDGGSRRPRHCRPVAALPAEAVLPRGGPLSADRRSRSNRDERLIVLRVAPCVHRRALSRASLTSTSSRCCSNAEGFARAVRRAVAPRGKREIAPTTWRANPAPRNPPGAGLHRPRGGARGDRGGAVEQGRHGGAARAAQAAVKGLGGVGKSVLAQEYAWRNRGRYHGVWWIRAEKSRDAARRPDRAGRAVHPRPQARCRTARRPRTPPSTPSRRLSAGEALAAHLRQRRAARRPRQADAGGGRAGADHHALAGLARARRAADPVDVFPPDVAVAVPAGRTPERRSGRGRARWRATLGYLPLALAHARGLLCGAAAMTSTRYRAELRRADPQGAARRRLSERRCSPPSTSRIEQGGGAVPGRRDADGHLRLPGARPHPARSRSPADVDERDRARRGGGGAAAEVSLAHARDARRRLPRRQRAPAGAGGDARAARRSGRDGDTATGAWRMRVPSGGHATSALAGVSPLRPRAMSRAPMA